MWLFQALHSGCSRVHKLLNVEDSALRFLDH